MISDTQDRYKNLTNYHEPQKSKPTPPQPNHAPDGQTTPELRDARVATHHTTHPIKRGGGDGDGDGAQTWEQRGREPDGIGETNWVRR